MYNEYIVIILTQRKEGFRKDLLFAEYFPSGFLKVRKSDDGEDSRLNYQVVHCFKHMDNNMKRHFPC